MQAIVQTQSIVTMGSTISQDDTASITTQPVQTSTDMNVIQATSPFQWMAVQLTGVVMSQVQDIMKDWILLDVQSLADVFCNPAFITDIHNVGEIFSLTMNAGTLKTSSKAKVPGYGQVWFAEHTITNVFSLALMEDRF